MPYSKSTQKEYGENPLQKGGGFKMKGSPHKLGTIIGTSAYKRLTEEYDTPIDDPNTEEKSDRAMEEFYQENPNYDPLTSVM